VVRSSDSGDCTNAPKPSMCTASIGGPNERIGPGSCAEGGAVIHRGGTIDGSNSEQSSCVSASDTPDRNLPGGNIQGIEFHSSKGSVSCSSHSP